MSRSLPRLRAAALLLALLLGAALPAAAQTRWVVRSEPGTPVVALEVLIAVGPADEAHTEAGLAHLAARSVIGPIRPVLDSLGAHLGVVAYKDGLAFSLTAAPDAWAEAARVLLVALFRDPPDSTATERERQLILAELRARESNPADALARETDAAFFGQDHPWGRSTVGSAETLQRLTVADVERFLQARVVPERAVAAAVGPVEARGVAELLGGFLPPGPVPPLEPMPAVASDSAVWRDYNSITTWIAAVYAFPADADEEALRMLADAAALALEFGPTRRSVYDAQAQVQSRRGGGELRIQLVVPPAEARQWGEQIRLTLDEMRRRIPGDEARFAERLRHFRGVRLRELASPEARAHEIARRFLRTGVASSLLEDLDSLTPERLAGAVRALAPPVLVYLGPFVDDTQNPTPGAGRR